MFDSKKYEEANPEPRVLMGPGPSDVSARVLGALGKPCIGHLDPYFLQIMNETQDLLRYVFQTENTLTFPVSGTGSSGMEASLVNLIYPGDKVLVCVNGVFGTRMADIVERLGGELIRLDFPWGRAINPDEVRQKAEETGPQIIAVVHAETSTGACSSLGELSQVCHDCGALFLVDCVTSLGGMAVDVDKNRIDAAYSGTQKCLSCPPGLAPITFSPAAMDKMNGRKQKAVSWYLDMSMIANYWGSDRTYHRTAPINMTFALHEALRIIADEGLEARHERHLKHHRALVSGLEAMGLEMLVPIEERLPMLNAVRIPDGAEDLPVRKRLLTEFGIEIGAGLGELAGKVWRIGLMGTSCTQKNVTLLLSALYTLLNDQGVRLSANPLEAIAESYKTD